MIGPGFAAGAVSGRLVFFAVFGAFAVGALALGVIGAAVWCAL